MNLNVPYVPRSPWFQQVQSRLNGFRASVDKKQARAFSLERIERVAGHVDRFAATCAACEGFKPRIEELLDRIDSDIQVVAKVSKKTYREALRPIVDHLRKEHRLVESGTYTGFGIAIGAGVGTALGAALDNYGMTGIGAGLGLVFGAAMEQKVRSEGRLL